MILEYETTDTKQLASGVPKHSLGANDFGVDADTGLLTIGVHIYNIGRPSAEKLVVVLRCMATDLHRQDQVVDCGGGLWLHENGSWFDCVEIQYKPSPTEPKKIVYLPLEWLRGVFEEPQKETTSYVTHTKELLDRVLTTVTAKNADYCADAEADPLDNFRNSERLDICSVDTAILSRMCDKITRVKNLMLKPGREARVAESVDDTIQDIIGYAALLAYSAKEQQDG